MSLDRAICLSGFGKGKFDDRLVLSLTNKGSSILVGGSIDKIKTDGLQPTLEAVFNKLGQPLPKCMVIQVVLLQEMILEPLKVGDRASINGQYAGVCLCT